METAAIRRLLTRLRIGKVIKISVIEAYHTFQDKRQYFSRARQFVFEKFVFESTKSRFSRFAEIRLSQTTVTHVGTNKVKYHLEVDTPPHFIFLYLRLCNHEIKN